MVDHLGNDFTVLGCSLCFAHIPKMPVFTDFLSTHVSPLSRSKKLFSRKTCTKRVKPGISPRLCHAFFRYVLLSASEISSFAVIPYALRSSSISSFVADDTLIFAHSFFAPVLAS